MNRSYVLDASALLCLLQSEPGADRVAEALPYAVIGAVNFSEAVGKLVEAGVEEREIDSVIDTLQLKVVPFDQEQARLAGLLRVATRNSACRWEIAPVSPLRACTTPLLSPARSPG